MLWLGEGVPESHSLLRNYWLCQYSLMDREGVHGSYHLLANNRLWKVTIFSCTPIAVLIGLVETVPNQ